MTDLLGKIDVVSEVEGPGGKTVIPRVVRHGVALAIAALFPEHFEKLRLGKYFYKGFLRSNVECKETVLCFKVFFDAGVVFSWASYQRSKKKRAE